MKVSREQVADNRRRILEAASTLFRARGFDNVTVSDVMKAAGLTHGAFYGHFASKDDLIAQALAHLLGQGDGAGVELPRFVDSYLSPAHRDNLAGGCPTATLGAESIRQSGEAHAAMREGLRGQIERLTAALARQGVAADAARQQAIGMWSAMVGAVMLSRAVDDPELSDELLAQTRAWVQGGLPAGSNPEQD